LGYLQGGKTTDSELTAEALFLEPEAVSWLDRINSCLLEVKALAQKANFMRVSDFVRWLANNTYVAGGMGRSEIVRRRILKDRTNAPRRIPIFVSCRGLETSIGPDARGLFLQLAPSVGALSLSVGTSGEPLKSVIVPRSGEVLSTKRRPVELLPAPVLRVGPQCDLRLIALQNRVLWIPAQMTPLAQQQLTANGWSVHQSAQLLLTMQLGPL
jgi:hypothetical protein